MKALKDVIATAGKLGWQEKLDSLQFLVIGPLKEVIIFGTEGLSTEKEFEEQYPSYPEISLKKIIEIDEKWRKLNSPFLSKPIAAIQAIQVENGTLFIQTRSAGFHHYIGTKTDTPRRLDNLSGLTKDFFMPVSFGAVTVTSDDWLPVGLRSQNVAVGRGKVDPMPSGFFDPVNEVVKTGPVGGKRSSPSLLTFITNELWEEMRIAWYDKITFLGLVHDQSEPQQPQIQIRINLTLSKAEVQKKFEQLLKEEGKKYAEISKYDFVADNIEAVRSYPGIWAPHSAAKLILHFTI